MLYNFANLTILNLLQKAKKILKNNKVSDIASTSAKNLNDGKEFANRVFGLVSL